MSSWIPQIDDWEQHGLAWGYIDEAKYGSITIPANGQFQLPQGDYTFDYPEGVLIQFSAIFDHPLCGWRLEANPGLDTENNFTVSNTSLGLSRPDILSYASIPPITPAGVYMIRIGSPWFWTKWMKLYIINTDSVAHTLFGHAYHIAVLKKPRPGRKDSE